METKQSDTGQNLYKNFEDNDLNNPIIYEDFDRRFANFSDHETYILEYTNSISKQSHSIEIKAKNKNDLDEILTLPKYKNYIDRKVHTLEPTERQLDYAWNLRIDLNNQNYSRKELSNLIDRAKHSWKIPHKQLIEFAENRKIYISKYIVKSTLYHVIFENLEHREKAYFYVFCVYRWFTRHEIRNPDVHPLSESFYKIADKLFEDEKFCRYFEKMKKNIGGERFRTFKAEDLSAMEKFCLKATKKILIQHNIINKVDNPYNKRDDKGRYIHKNNNSIPEPPSTNLYKKEKMNYNSNEVKINPVSKNDVWKFHEERLNSKKYFSEDINSDELFKRNIGIGVFVLIMGFILYHIL